MEHQAAVHQESITSSKSIDSSSGKEVMESIPGSPESVPLENGGEKKKLNGKKRTKKSKKSDSEKENISVVSRDGFILIFI